MTFPQSLVYDYSMVAKTKSVAKYKDTNIVAKLTARPGKFAVEEAMVLLATGLSLTDTATRLGVTKQAVHTKLQHIG